MALITEIPVGFKEFFLSDVREDFEYKSEKNADGPGYTVTEEYDTPYGGGGRLLGMQVSAYVEERGLTSLVSFPVNVVIPEDGADATLARIRALPRLSPIVLDSLVVRHGQGKTGNKNIYQMFSAKGISFPGSTPVAPTRSAPPVPPATATRAA